MRNTLALLFAALFASSATAQQAVDQRTLARTLQNGRSQDRHAALRQAGSIGASQREEILWVALAGELERARADSHRRHDDHAAGRNSQPLEESQEGYVTDLVEAVSQWHDPRALRPLVSAVGSGNAAGLAILRFGEAAVSPLLNAAVHGHSTELGGVLFTLALLLEGRSGDIPPGPIAPAQLSNAARNQILKVSRELLRPGFPWFHLQPMATLALATGDDELRRQVELLAKEPGMVAAYGVQDPNEIGGIQAGLRRALARHQHQ